MTEDQTGEDSATIEITTLNKDIIDTHNNKNLTKEEKNIKTEVKENTEERRTLDNTSADTNIDKQTTIMIEEEETGSIMDIDIESTSHLKSI
ncbi:unnamed protein product [Rhizophagus irregularis]|uniref:Uncharacterized protein n=1 Tax=Rhizophagus irregularis TaxID=588596 RepID=A0A916EJR5_9GLOM|nr:unnamed protein product [Rhizophagus irregularis]